MARKEYLTGTYRYEVVTGPGPGVGVNESILKITNNVRIKQEGYDIILEKGDRIRVLNEADDKFTYSMLSRLQTDCEYVIRTAHSTRSLWGNTVESHIEYMRKLYDSLRNKPEWITSQDIDYYEKELKKYGK